MGTVAAGPAAAGTGGRTTIRQGGVNANRLLPMVLAGFSPTASLAGHRGDPSAGWETATNLHGEEQLDAVPVLRERPGYQEVRSPAPRFMTPIRVTFVVDRGGWWSRPRSAGNAPDRQSPTVRREQEPAAGGGTTGRNWRRWPEDAASTRGRSVRGE